MMMNLKVWLMEILHKMKEKLTANLISSIDDDDVL